MQLFGFKFSGVQNYFIAITSQVNIWTFFPVTVIIVFLKRHSHSLQKYLFLQFQVESEITRNLNIEMVSNYGMPGNEKKTEAIDMLQKTVRNQYSRPSIKICSFAVTWPYFFRYGRSVGKIFILLISASIYPIFRHHPH